MMRIAVIKPNKKMRIYPFDDEEDGMIEVDRGRLSLPYAYHLGYVSIENAETIARSLDEAIQQAQRSSCEKE